MSKYTFTESNYEHIISYLGFGGYFTKINLCNSRGLSPFARFLYMRQYTTIKPNNLNYQTV